MAARCFKCSAPLDGDFGMITCTQCGEINFLDDGPSEAPAESPADSPAQMPAPPNFPPPPPPSMVETASKFISLPPDGSKVEGWQIQPPPPELGREEVPESVPPPPVDAIKEIADFGNQPVDNSSVGALFYDVQISRIDTLELRKAVVAALQDAKFKWQSEELENKIHNGILTIPRLSPIKASILVKKIRHLDVDVSWTQGNVYEAPPQ